MLKSGERERERETERERDKGAKIGRREMRVGHRREILACCEFIIEFLCIFLIL